MSTPQLPPQAQELLKQLEPIIAPPAVGWWPLAPGWWILIALGISAVSFIVLWIYQYYSRNAYRRQALQLLATIQPAPNSSFIKNLTGLLKRTALSAYPERSSQINQAFGSQWVDFLNNSNPKAAFSSALAKAMTDGAYKADANPSAELEPHGNMNAGNHIDAYALKRQAQKWIKTHPGKYKEAQHV